MKRSIVLAMALLAVSFSACGRESAAPQNTPVPPPAPLHSSRRHRDRWRTRPAAPPPQPPKR